VVAVARERARRAVRPGVGEPEGRPVALVERERERRKVVLEAHDVEGPPGTRAARP
jgi:hypothetical protein